MNSFEEVLAQYEPMISAIIRKLNIYRDFEQFRQAGRVALWQAWERFDESKGSFTPFAYRSIYGALLDEIKRENRFSTVNTSVETETIELLGSTVPFSTHAEEIHAGLSTVVKALAMEERQLLVMLFVEKTSQTECAEFFGISIAGVKKRRERLLRKLKQRLMTPESE